MTAVDRVRDFIEFWASPGDAIDITKPERDDSARLAYADLLAVVELADFAAKLTPDDLADAIVDRLKTRAVVPPRSDLIDTLRGYGIPASEAGDLADELAQLMLPHEHDEPARVTCSLCAEEIIAPGVPTNLAMLEDATRLHHEREHPELLCLPHHTLDCRRPECMGQSS